MSPPPSTSTNLANGSSSSPPLSNDVNRTDGSSSIDSKTTPPVIYPWMRKVHINNPGRKKNPLLVNRAKRYEDLCICSYLIYLMND